MRLSPGGDFLPPRHRKQPSPCKRSAAGRGQGEGHKDIRTANVFAGKPVALTCKLAQSFTQPNPCLSKDLILVRGRVRGPKHAGQNKAFARSPGTRPCPASDSSNRRLRLPLILTFSPAPLTLRRGEGKRRAWHGADQPLWRVRKPALLFLSLKSVFNFGERLGERSQIYRPKLSLCRQPRHASLPRQRFIIPMPAAAPHPDLLPGSADAAPRRRKQPSPCKRSAAGRGQGEGHKDIRTANVFAGKPEH